MPIRERMPRRLVKPGMALWSSRQIGVEVITVLARFRPTRGQVLGHRLYLGLRTGAAVAVITGVPLTARLVGGWPVPARAWLGWLAVSTGPVLVGLVAGLGGTGVGADADDRGVRRVPGEPLASGAWRHIVDIRAERRTGRTAIAVYLDTGVILRLRAPYDGRLLARDRYFEQKLFTLRHLWENHRHRIVDSGRAVAVPPAARSRVDRLTGADRPPVA